MWYILALLIGISIGCVISATVHKQNKGHKNVGILKVVESDDGGPPYLFVELEQDARLLFNEKTVSMDVRAISLNSLK